VKVDLGAKSDLELAQLHTQKNDWYSRAGRTLLQARAATRQIEPEAIAALKQQTTGNDVPQILRALWTLHVIGALDGDQLPKSAQHSSDLVRAWAVQLATEQPGKSKLSEATLLQLAKSDPSPTVRLAVASALPALDTPQNWKVGEALAAHAEDRDDRF